jgi:hypothetical protein
MIIFAMEKSAKNIKKISMLIYAGTKEQYLLIEQLTQYFLNTFNIEPEDCLVRVLLVMQEIFGKRNISFLDIDTLPEKEQRIIFRDAIYSLIDFFKLEQDKLKIYSECLKLYEDWSSDFKI